jgi:inorganic pyrophosphatase/exopolyphosphatase
MLIITAGTPYIDIDAYASSVAYAELLNLLGRKSIAASSSVLNKSITGSLRALPVPFSADYQPHEADEYILVDISDPARFDKIVDVNKVVEVIDHHSGFKEYWREQLGVKGQVEFIGAAATLVYERWRAANRLNYMSKASAMLLAASILDNTLNFRAHVTTERDKAAYEFLAGHAALDERWAAAYFSECQRAIAADLPTALRNDTKLLRFKNFSEELCVGQLVVWDAGPLISAQLETIADMMGRTRPFWFANLVSIAEGRSYFLAYSPGVQRWLQGLLGITFTGTTARADRLWLRKEIMRAAQDNAVTAWAQQS